MKNNFKMSIVIPCYNEAENIPLILKRFSEVIGDKNIEIILVDNGSYDNTSAVLTELLPKYPFAKRTIVKVNQGYGYGILYGLKECDGDYLGFTHADMQTDPYDVIRAYEIIEKENEDNIFIKGNRKGRPLFDNIFTFGMGIFETLYFHTNMSDINAEPSIFPMSFYKKLENPPYDFSFDLYVFYMAKRFGLKIVRFPVNFPKRIHGSSKWNTGLKSKIKFIKRTISYSINLKRELINK